MDGVSFIGEQTKIKEDNYGELKKVLEDSCRLQEKISIINPSFHTKDQKNIGSKKGEFFDIQPWLDSDCEDDFINVKAGSKEGVFFNWSDSACEDDFTSVKADTVLDKENSVSVYEDKKVEELVPHQDPQLNISTNENNINAVITPSTREPEVLPEKYSCLSCFSFYIPILSNPSQESSKLLANDKESGTVMVKIDFDEKTELAFKRNSRAKLWEFILPCIVNGALFESISSLIIVTCAATANIPNGNILALAMTNLITGFFIIRHNLERVQRQHKQKMGASGIKVEQENQLKKVGKNILEYLLPFTMTVLSFLFFGMVPPLVYVFTFRGTDDKNFELATMVGASLLCTTLLAFLKAHLQKPKNWVFYGKTVACFVFIGVLAFVLSYLAGDLFGKLIQKFDYWFE